MRRGIRAVVVTLACASAIGVAVAPTLSGARNPSLLFATPLTAGGEVRTAIDARGFIYLAGNVAGGTPISARAAFVTKLTPSGSPLYTTYFQGARFGGEYNDCGIEIHAIAVDRNGAAYVAGCTSADDFPVVRPLVATLPNSRGGAFLAKLDAAGTIVYSTYFRASNATAIAADDDGNAYVVGTSGDGLPLVNPTLTEGPGFAAKLDPAGAHILYSTYLDASPRAIALDRSGAAFLAGGADPFVSLTGSPPRCRDGSADAEVITLAPSGSRYDYAICLGGSGSEAATGIAIDSSGAAYVVGATSSVDFPTVRPLDLPLHTGALWKTDDGGDTWTNLPLGAFSVTQLVATAAQPPTWFANGSFRSLDQGRTWQRLGQTFSGVTPDPALAAYALRNDFRRRRVQESGRRRTVDGDWRAGSGKPIHFACRRRSARLAHPLCRQRPRVEKRSMAERPGPRATTGSARRRALTGSSSIPQPECCSRIISTTRISSRFSIASSRAWMVAQPGRRPHSVWKTVSSRRCCSSPPGAARRRRGRGRWIASHLPTSRRRAMRRPSTSRPESSSAAQGPSASSLAATTAARPGPQ